MTFVSRLAFVVIFAVIATVVAVAVICFAASERVNFQIERARVANLLTNLRTATEANLSIGLALDQVSPLQERIEREKASDPSVLAIDIFNSAGRAFYSTDRSVIGESVPTDWVRRLADAGIWQTVERGDTVFGTHFENDLGVAGGISVTTSDRGRIARSDSLGLSLTSLVVLLAAVGGATAALAAGIFNHVMSRPFERVARILSGEAVSTSGDVGLPRLATAAQHSWTQAAARVDRGLSQLGALDDAA
ncbi:MULTISPECIES: hypothetical protein [unclassified Xanthobacter]|uniref:hypothetical protein n=1 Tax=Xanthobacter TaxID=279 RepID=UPI001F3ECDEE|nr:MULTISPECIES: hypothetical protein [unclassified Xanthobacter]